MYRGPSDKPIRQPPEDRMEVTVNPPLGQSTVLPFSENPTVIFTALVQSHIQIDQKFLAVALWHDFSSDGSWDSLDFEATSNSGAVIFGEGQQVNSYFFKAELKGLPPRPGPIHFTVKFRLGPEHEWKWINQRSTVSDGEIIYQSGAKVPSQIEPFLQGISPAVTVKSEPSEAPETSLWVLQAPLKGADGHDSSFTDVVLGAPRDVTKWMALVRFWAPWLSPEHGRTKFSPAKDAILCSFLRNDGFHLTFLALSGLDDVLSIFKSDGDGNIICHSRNDSQSQGSATVIASFGRDFESTIAAVMYHARKISRLVMRQTGEEEAELKAAIEGVKPEWLENWYDGLTYCTWNGVGQDLSEQKILDALQALKEQNINITNLIIDDNWQTLDNEDAWQFYKGWVEFEANKKGFPNGLKHTITRIRDTHRHIQHVAVWHALLGYWGGIAPEGKLAAKYKTLSVLMKKGLRPPGGKMVVISDEDVKQFYDDFYRFLSDAGVDSVKTDSQFFLDQIVHADDRHRLTRAYQDAWTISSLRWFSTKTISCMSQTPQIMFHSQLPTNKPRIMLRNSDDFFPEVDASHAWHIFCNAHNSILTQHLNVLPDWDMFQTSHPWAAFHGAARCISGGPIYITDVPGEHDLDLIHEMTAQTPGGKTVILRPPILGKTTQQYIHYDEDRLTKIGTFCGHQKTGTGILGLFNVSQKPLTELLGLDEFPGLVSDKEYVVRAHRTGEISNVVRCSQSAPLFATTVDVRGWNILTAYPLIHLQPEGSGDTPKDGLRVANLGLLGKMTGVAATVSIETSVEKSGRARIKLSLKALGVLGLYISGLAERSIERDFLAVMLGKVIPVATVKKGSQPNLLEIDIEKAWYELGLDAGWSNEVGIEISIRQPST